MEVFISQRLGFASRAIQKDQRAERKTKQNKPIAEREYKKTNMLMDRDPKAIPQAQQASAGLLGAPSFQSYQLTSQSISCQKTRPACLWVMESETARSDTASPSGMETRDPEERLCLSQRQAAKNIPYHTGKYRSLQRPLGPR